MRAKAIPSATSVFGPKANIRREVFSVEYGREVDTFGVDSSGLWRRVFCQCTRVANQDWT